MLTYRLANPAPVFWNVTKTIVAIAIFDAIVVWGIPQLILLVQHADTGLGLFFPPLVPAGETVMAVGTVLLVWAGLTLAIKGKGTPLPFDSPRELVISGPYAWLRTPMVTGVLAQVVGYGLYTGSILVFCLVPLFALCWNSLVRPTEEDVLQTHFSRSFELYRRSVRCWLPMRSPWQPPPEIGLFPVSQMPDRERRKRRRRR